jgi:hypothetical protein
MKTRLSALFIFVLFTLCFCSAQAEPKRDKDPKETFEQTIQRLKKKTVIFVLPKSEYQYIDEYTSMLTQAWTLTPLKVIKFDEYASYEKDIDSYAFFSMTGAQVSYASSSSPTRTSNSTFFYLTLNIRSSDGKAKDGTPKLKFDRLARIELYPKSSSMFTFPKSDFSTFLYVDCSFRNFSLPYMIAYLKFVQQNLKNGKDPSVYTEYDDKALLSKLKTDTLYVPDSLLNRRPTFSAKEQAKNERLLSKYKGKFKFVSIGELTNIIKTRGTSKPVFIFEYVQSSNDKYVSVLDARSGTVVYRRYKAISYKLRSKDLRRIID